MGFFCLLSVSFADVLCGFQFNEQFSVCQFTHAWSDRRRSTDYLFFQILVHAEWQQLGKVVESAFATQMTIVQRRKFGTMTSF